MLSKFVPKSLLSAVLLLVAANSLIVYGQKGSENNPVYATSDNYSENMERVLDGKPLVYDASDMPKAVYDACSSASTLTVDGAPITGTTNSHSLEGGESVDCVTSGGGSSIESSWHRFNTGSNTSLNLSWTYTNNFNCFPGIVVWGPFAPGGGCLPSGASVHCTSIQNGDPGYHRQLSVTANMDYLVQIAGRNCGGGGDRFVDYELGVYTVPTNNVASGADGIDQCGVVYNGTNIGYSPTNGVPGLEDLDGNAGTTCPTCTAGDDVSYIVNNDSWFTFCATDAGTWSVDFSNIANCTQNRGLQMTIFRGTSGNLTQIENAPSPSAPGSSWTSATFAVSAGECIFMVVDGFAGDQCDYSYTLNNISGGCNLVSLPINLLEFNAELTDEETVDLTWSTVSEVDNEYFTIERSADGRNFSFLTRIEGAGNSTVLQQYQTTDDHPLKGVSYYRLSQTDADGQTTSFDMVAVNNDNAISDIAVVPNPIIGNATLFFGAGAKGACDITIYDLSGRKLYSEQVNAQKGRNRVELKTVGFPSGMYLAVIANDRSQQNIRFVKK